jgi:hypothetical protein
MRKDVDREVDMEDAEEIQQVRETDEEETPLADFFPDPLAYFIGATRNGNLASAIDDTLYRISAKN